MNFTKEKKVAEVAARMAGKYLENNFSKVSRSRNFKLKSKDQIQTPLDKGAEKIIINEIKKHFPTHRIYSEEIGDNLKNSDYYWIIDPLDGTTNYTMHLPTYGVAIGLAYKEKMVLGITYVPVLKELTVAELGKGAFINNKRLRVSKRKKISDSILIFCHGSLVKDMKRAIKLYKAFKLKTLDLRQIGSAVVEFQIMAMGRVEAVMLPGGNLHDVATGALIVKEAGGKVTDFNNKEWTIYSKDILVSNGLVHNQVLKIIKQSLK
ncbi:inositol monophosphatase [bacterium]|jgi:myo-inositol-1(or 4)-monophosphatase|nr:inositol monophosphatase [bacterium]MBT4121407.1 inositol monophosphatase [bacterium]MBT4335637.1 inositol monophosphatase [bacterium]MBT4763675.1 inositol monophosphatase [bacterium]MBT5401046.1 inositol monophosphatase [bacterium]